MKIEKENVALEVDTGASVSILNKKTCNLICRNSFVNWLPTSSKLNSYSGELIHPLGKIVCEVNYEGKRFQLLLEMVNDQIYWGEICCM